MILEVYYSLENGFILQFLKLFRFSLTYGTAEEIDYYSILSFGFWKFDISIALEKDNNAHNIKEKWHL